MLTGLGWYGDGRAGKDVYFLAQGFKWNQLKEYNQNLRAEQDRLGWSDARDLLNASHRTLVAFMKDRTKGANTQ